MEENQYHIKKQDLDIILIKMGLEFTEVDKKDIVKIINSKDPPDSISISHFSITNKLNIMKIYLDWQKIKKNKIIDNIQHNLENNTNLNKEINNQDSSQFELKNNSQEIENIHNDEKNNIDNFGNKKYNYQKFNKPFLSSRINRYFEKRNNQIDNMGSMGECIEKDEVEHNLENNTNLNKEINNQDSSQFEFKNNSQEIENIHNDHLNEEINNQDPYQINKDNNFYNDEKNNINNFGDKKYNYKNFNNSSLSSRINRYIENGANQINNIGSMGECIEKDEGENNKIETSTRVSLFDRKYLNKDKLFPYNRNYKTRFPPIIPPPIKPTSNFTNHYLQNDNQNKKEGLINNDYEKELLETKLKMFKLKVDNIKILNSKNEAIIKEIHLYNEDYEDRKQLITEFRKKVDDDVYKERDEKDKLFEEDHQRILEPLINDKNKHCDDLTIYIKEALEFYDLYVQDYDEEEYNNLKDELITIQEKVTSIKDKKTIQSSNISRGFFSKIKTLTDKLKDIDNENNNYDLNENKYFKSLNKEEQEEILDIEKKIEEINLEDIPLRFKVLQKDISMENKAMIINKLNEYKKNKYLSDSGKYYNWLHGLLKIPFGVYKNLPITREDNEIDIQSYLKNTKNILDSAVYGHEETKNNIVKLIAQWISNPSSSGNVIGIQGPMGNGKTTLVKNGIAKAIERPFEFISLGGSSDSAYLNGHSYTYEGATWGQIVNILMNSNCMNPVFYFDELDKVSNTPKGEEIINLLVHLTDSTQNTKFQDRYFSGIDVDLSRSVFIFSYNELDKINPILLDRFIQIKTDGFNTEDKINIFKDFLYVGISKELGIKEDIVFSEEIIKILIQDYTQEKGVRQLKKLTYSIMSHINLSILMDENDYKRDDKNQIIIDREIIEKILKKENDKNPSIENMYI